MTTGEPECDRALISLPSRHEMMLVQSVIDSLAEKYGGALSQDEHTRLLEIMGDVQHHLRRCVRYEKDDEHAKSSDIQPDLRGLPPLEKARADVLALEQQVMAKAAHLRDLNNQIPSKLENIAQELNAATSACVGHPAEALSGEVDSAGLQADQPRELVDLRTELRDLQRSMTESKVRLQSHRDVLHQKRGPGARRERSLLPDTAPNALL